MEDSLFVKSEIELLDFSLQEIEADFKTVREIIGSKNDESDILASLQNSSLKGAHDQIVRGLVAGCLLGMNWLKYLLLTSRDHFKVVCTTLALVLPKLKTTSKIVDLLMTLLKTDSPAYPDTFLYFLRTMPLIKQIKSDIEIVISQPTISMIFYKLLRQAALENDAEKIEYMHAISYIWKRRKDQCLAIGRDLVRLISALAEVNGIEEIWNDLFSEPKDSGPPTYCSLLSSPTNPKYHSMLLPPILESKIAFVIEHAPQVSFTRYLKWVLENYSMNMVPDIVRFIVTYLPRHENCPRWQIIAWLLNSTNDHHIQANIKQALVFDCLFFSPADQLYSVEPALSLIKYSIGKYTHIAEEILEFVLTSAELYDKRSTPNIMKNLKEVMNTGYINGIFPALESLCKNEKIDELLRSRLIEINDLAATEPSVLPFIETEDTYINTKRLLMENLGENAIKFSSEPSFEGLWQILNRFYMIGEDLHNFLMKCLVHEYSLPLSTEMNPSHILFKAFSECENNAKINEFVKHIISVESAISVRFLIFCLHTCPNLYLKYSDKLEKDLKSALEDLSFQSISWIFRKVFQNFAGQITPSILHFFLQIASVEQIHQLEIDLLNDQYTVIGENLSAILERSSEFTSTEQIFLWKIIQAEVVPEKLDKILEAFQRNLNTQWEALSGLLQYLLSYIAFIRPEHVKVLLSFPARNFKGAVLTVVSQINPDFVEEAVSFILLKGQFQAQINLLKHLKLWVEGEGKLAEIIKSKNLQNLLSSTLHSLSSDYFKEFNKLLEPKHLFPR